jgi:hypothetical protein
MAGNVTLGKVKAWLTSIALTWSAKQTMSAELAISNLWSFSSQSFALNGAAQTIASGASMVIVTGSTGSSSIKVPASPSTNVAILVVNSTSAVWTLDGNGANIDNASTLSVPVNASFFIVWNGTLWRTLGAQPAYLTTVFGQLASSNTWSGSGGNSFTNGAVTLGRAFIRTIQTFAAGGTISATGGGSLVTYTGAAGQTLNLPTTSLSTGQVLTVKDMSGNGVTVGRNGKNIDGAASDIVLGAYGKTTVMYDGTNWGTI